jgi:hypothetical protein
MYSQIDVFDVFRAILAQLSQYAISRYRFTLNLTTHMKYTLNSSL